MDLKNPPSATDLLAAIEPQPIHIVVTGHVALERLIELCIVESLANPAVLELDRVPFLQKLALSVALGILGESSMPAYKTLNTLRNKVAHDLILALDKQVALDLRNSMSSAQRKGLSLSPSVDPFAVLREVIGALYTELRSALEHRRERRLRAEAYNDITREALTGANYGQAWVDGRRSLEIELRSVSKRKKLNSVGLISHQNTKVGPGISMNSIILLHNNGSGIWLNHHRLDPDRQSARFAR